MTNIAFVVTDHGWGHGSRCSELVRVLSSRNVDCKINILLATSIPQGFFESYIGQPNGVEYYRIKSDVGVVQVSGVEIDLRKTVEVLGEFFCVGAASLRPPGSIK
jgi:hypothetical protein